MTGTALLEQTLERVVERIGDPAPHVYAQLFDSAPELRAMFVNDPSGSVRGEMFHRVVEALLDVAGDRPYAGSMIAAEWFNHRGIGVPPQQFEAFFGTVVQVFRQALGPDWTDDVDAAWHDTLRRVADITARCATDVEAPSAS
jgi:hemoglobin-like flavoprotein